MVEKRTVYAGVCKKNGERVCGVVEEQDFCDEGSWIPPHLVAGQGHPDRICAYYPDTQVIGRCGEGGQCSNLAERCDDPASFIPRDPNCRITKDYGPSGEYTTYGKCGDRCVWSRSDCEEGEEYVKDDSSCTANKVKLGACLNGYGYCTVSRDTCANEPYYTHSDMLEKFEANCYLAELPKTEAPIAPSPPTASPAVVPTLSPISDPIKGTTIEDTNPFASTPDGMSQGALLGITIATTLIVGIFIGFIASRVWSDMQTKRAEAKPPLKKITLGKGKGHEIIVDPGEELSIA
jgi:hypothetical protein